MQRSRDVDGLFVKQMHQSTDVMSSTLSPDAGPLRYGGGGEVASLEGSFGWLENVSSQSGAVTQCPGEVGAASPLLSGSLGRKLRG